MKWKQAALAGGIALVHFAAWAWLWGSVFERAMGGRGDWVPDLRAQVLVVLQFPLMTFFDIGLMPVLNSLLWGVVFGLGLPMVWRTAKRRPSVAA